MTEEEFDRKYKQALDDVLLAMAENAEVDPKRFYSMTCVVENLSFFGPVVYGLLKNARKK